MAKFRVRAVCDECRREWTTNAKKDPTPPSRCKYCESSKTRKLDAWRLKE